VKLELDDLKKKIGILPPMPVPISYAAAGSAIPPGSAALVLLQDECKQHMVLSAINPIQPAPPGERGLSPAKTLFGSRPARNPLLHLVQSPGNKGQTPPASGKGGAAAPPHNKPGSDPSSGPQAPSEPSVEEQATRIADQIKNEIKQELAGDLKEYNDLDHIKPENRTTAQDTRLEQIKTKIENAVQSKLDELLDELKGTGGFVNKDRVGLIYRKLKDFDEELLDSDGMTQIDPTSIHVGAPTGGTTTGPVGTTKITGNAKFFKGQVQGPGDLELEDAQHHLQNIHVDNAGNFSKEVDTPNFKPIKFTFTSESGTWVWQNGQWQQQLPTGTAKSSGSPAPPSSTGKAGSTTESERPMSGIPFRFDPFHRDAGGMTQIDPPKSDQPTKPISGNFGKLPEGVVPKHVDLVNASGQMIQLKVGPGGQYEGHIPEDFTPVKQILSVIGTDGKPYIANYEIINGEFRPVGKFQQAGPTNEELHQEMIEHGTGYEPMRSSKAPLAPAPSKAGGGSGTTGSTGSTGQSGAMAPVPAQSRTQTAKASFPGDKKFTMLLTGTYSREPKESTQDNYAFVAATLVGVYENPTSWSGGMRQNWNLAALAPPVVGCGKKGSYALEIEKTAAGLQELPGQYRDIQIFVSPTDFSSVGRGRVAIPDDIQFLNLALFQTEPGRRSSADSQDERYYTPTGDIRFSGLSSAMGWTKPSVKLNYFYDKMQDAGFTDQHDWEALTKPPDEYQAGAVLQYSYPEGALSRWKNASMPFISYWELNPQRSIAPAPSLEPTDWPITQGNALPRFSLLIDEVLP
jgi:hypothetical protein